MIATKKFPQAGKPSQDSDPERHNNSTGDCIFGPVSKIFKAPNQSSYTLSIHCSLLPMEVIGIRDIHGGKITLKIVRKRQAVRLSYTWICEVTCY